jgi:hypothetical protein
MPWSQITNIKGPPGEKGEAGLANGSFSKLLTTHLDLYVSTSGSDSTGDGTEALPWATPHRAMRELFAYIITPEALATVHIADGQYTFSEPLEIGHPNGERIKVLGGSVGSSKPSSSDLTGNAETGNTAGSLAFNDAVLAGYYNTRWQFNAPQALLCTSGNGVTLDRILVRGAGQTTTAGLSLKGGSVNLGTNYSGNVAFCNCSVGVGVAARSLKAPGIQIVNCNTGLRVSGGTAELDSLVVANCSAQGIDCSGGTTSASMATSQRNGASGVRAYGAAVVEFSYSNCSFNNGDGIEARGAATVTANSSKLRNQTRSGAVASGSASVSLDSAQLSGNQMDGLSAGEHATLSAGYGQILSNGQVGLSLSGCATVKASGASISSHPQVGVSVNGPAYLDAWGATISSNTGGGVSIQQGGAAYLVQASLTGNGGTGIKVQGDGYVDFTGGDPAVTLSPAANTLGNGRGYISR